MSPSAPQSEDHVPVVLRDATAGDLPAINDIYNHYVICSTCTYQVPPETPEARLAWFEGRGLRHPVVVAEQDGTIVAWGSLSPFHKREGYACTVENSVYVHPARHRQGLGRLIMEELIRRAPGLGVRSIIAGISADQEASIALHAKLGFVEVGRLREAGWKFGRWLDVITMQLMLPRPESGDP